MLHEPPSAAILAETLIQEWEARQTLNLTLDYCTARSQLQARLTAFCQLMCAGDINIDADDVRTVLHSTTAFTLHAARVQGYDRATQAVAILLNQPPVGLGPAQLSASRWSLLSISSGPSYELEMEELTQIVETIQTSISDEMEMIFGHGIDEELAGTELVVWLLMGYS